MSKKVYIVITYSYMPSQEQHSKLDQYEKCEFVDSLTNTHYTNASIIIDYINEIVIKDRSQERNYNKYIKYVTENYPQQMKELAEEYKDGKSNTN